MGLRHLSLGLVIGVLLSGCAGFSYHYYSLSGADYTKGVLLGDAPEHDEPFVVCEPNVGAKFPCVIVKADEFFRMKQDYMDTKQKLKDCQSHDGGG
jgi:hypothetical protein